MPSSEMLFSVSFPSDKNNQITRFFGRHAEDMQTGVKVSRRGGIVI
jgi:hypothetical protein